MLILKTNAELKKVFARLINTASVPVTWTDQFVVINNKLVLLGTGRSLIFDFDNKKVYTNLLDISTENKVIEIIPNQALINNIVSMTLYAFGKWGSIGGLKVEKDYAALNELFANVFRPVGIEAALRSDNMRFYQNGLQITFEDAVLAAMQLLKDEQKAKADTGKEVSEQTKQDTEDQEGQKDDAVDGEERNAGYMEEDEYEMGLWHKMVWKKETCVFEKHPQSETDTVKSRIGNNFYMTEYQCPKCQEKLYMAVYPVDKEILIETEEARVYMARTYACNTCNAFYTPRPDRLLQEGDVYSLKFDVDRVAYEDYLEILGNKAERTTNYKFNEYESDRQSGKKEDRMDSDKEAEEVQEEVPEEVRAEDIQPEEEGEWKAGQVRRQGKEKSGIFGRRGIRNAGKRRGKPFGVHNIAKAEETGKEQAEETEEYPREQDAEVPEQKEDQTVTGNGECTEQETPETEAVNEAERKTQETVTTSGRQVGSTNEDKQEEINRAWKERVIRKREISQEMKQHKDRLMGKTTEELKVILAGMENKAESVAAEHGGSGLAAKEYIEVIKEALREKLTAKYDARVETLGNLTIKQLTELKKQIEDETSLSAEEKAKYIKRVDNRLYQMEVKAVEQKIELGKNKSYAQLEQLIDEIEKGVESEELKQEALKKLKRIKADRAEREIEQLITRMPLHLDRKQLSVYLDQLGKYKEVDITQYRNRIEQRKDMAEKEEIAAMIRRGGKKDRNSLWELYGQLRNEDYKDENKEPFLEKIYEKIRKMDEAEIERICPDVASLSFQEGLAAYEKIKEGMFLPELKTNTLEMIERRLTKLKTDESVQLMRKLKHEMEEKMPGFTHFYFYDAREERRRNEREEYEDEEQDHIAMMRAVNGYASARDQYEYPIIVGDTSRSSNGKEGFVLTPDHIFYHTLLSSGVVSIMDIEQVEEGRGLFKKGIYLKHFTGKKEKLPTTVNAEDLEVFADILTDFVTYLQEKPESRSVSYLAKEKHDVKCCYRCGFVYKEGNICPKCGSKMNQ